MHLRKPHQTILQATLLHKNTSSEQDTKENIRLTMTNFRSDINRTIGRIFNYVYPYFESKDNSTYKSIIDIYLQNPDHMILWIKDW